MGSGDRLRATYEFKPVDHLVRTEFYIWPEAIERWKTEGLPDDYQEQNLFNFDPPARVSVRLNMGWCEPPFCPAYDEKVVRSEGKTEIIQDSAGRWLRVLTGRRHGFMPEYVRHPVTCDEDWERDVLPRLDPHTPERWMNLELVCDEAAARREEENVFVRQNIIGGYMYLRALMGPVDVLYAFHEKPALLHRMMAHWAAFMNYALERVQKRVDLDELALGEDICYNHGLLISPDMVREFLLPHYQDLVKNAQRRQKRRLYIYVDTDGWVEPAIPLYLQVGMDVMDPFEVASGCDVVDLGTKFPKLIMGGGIDKRVLARGEEQIDRHLKRIIPAMVERGGYIPTCDHGVPDNVSFASYLYYRRRICELDH